MDKKDKKKIASIASIVTICIASAFALLGFLGKSSFTPLIIDKVFGITDHVTNEIVKKIDSGYSNTFILSPKDARQDATILFYAQHGQMVRATINSAGRGAPTKFQYFVDNMPWNPGASSATHADITNILRFDMAPGGDIHVLKIIPSFSSNDSFAVVDCLVLVYSRNEVTK
jgi:hypothetical protein